MTTTVGTKPNIPRPQYASMSVADALKTNWRGWYLSRKMDGCFEWRGNICGERMRDGTFHPFDADMPGNWRERSTAMAAAFQPGWQRIPEGQGEVFIREMIDCARRDGTPDVCVGKPIDAGFGCGLVKIKLVETYDCIVTDTGGGRLSIGLEFQGQPAGRCPVFNLAMFDSLRVGDWVEITGTRTAHGKFREPQFSRTRPDKGGNP